MIARFPATHPAPTRRSVMAALAGGLVAATAARAQAPAARAPILIANVRIFDGIDGGLRSGSLLIVGDRIAEISSGAIAPPDGATILDGGGRVLMPGLTDAHWHMTMAANSMADMLTADTGLMYASTVAEAERTLMRGFTTVRDIAGPVFGIKAAIDAGLIPGPRVYPSGALISQTSGHGDFTPVYEAPRTIGGSPSRFEEIGLFAIANGPAEVLAAVRAQLKRGASQIKMALGGGVFSDSDPIDTLQYSREELRAAVQAASDWGTYVAAHVYTSAGIRRALEGGVRSIEHGHLADEATIRLMAEKGAWLSTQPFEPGDNPVTPAQAAKAKPTVGGWQRTCRWAKKHGANVAFGTDLLFQSGGANQENTLLTRLAQVFTNAEVLKIATSGNCRLFAMSGERNPYKEARLGVLEAGAWADMLLVSGDPIEDLGVLRDYERNLALIIKNGEIHKNLLAPSPAA